MSAGSLFSSLAWFIAIVALIPLALWLLKRSPVGSGGPNGVMRSVAVLSLAPNQRLVTVEVGQGLARRWLLLGVTAQSITMLHEMAPQDDAPATTPAATTFSQLLGRLYERKADHDAP